MDNVLEKILDVECSAYDFKEAVEKKKTKSWLKSISACYFNELIEKKFLPINLHC